jgi:hypothetical protein
VSHRISFPAEFGERPELPLMVKLDRAEIRRSDAGGILPRKATWLLDATKA